jgi:2'-5' RNA ligase
MATAAHTRERNAWSYFNITETDGLTALYEYLEEALPAAWSRESNPHITIYPEFTVKEHIKTDVQNCLLHSGKEYESTRINVNDVYCHHALSAPKATYTIALDINIDLTHLRKLHEAHITNAGGKIVTTPVNPHITLFVRDQSQTECGVMDIRTAQQTQTAIETLPSNVIPDSIRIDSRNVAVKEIR